MVKTSSTRRVWPAYLLSLGALAVALGASGPGSAALAASKKQLVTGQGIKNNSITGKDIKDGSLTAADVAPGTFLPPSALSSLSLTLGQVQSNSFDAKVTAQEGIAVPVGGCIAPSLAGAGVGAAAPGDVAVSTITNAAGGPVAANYLTTLPTVMQPSSSPTPVPVVLVCNYNNAVTYLPQNAVIHVTVLHRTSR